MKKLSKVVAMFSLIFMSPLAQAQYISAGDPHSDMWWWYEQATIKNAEIAIKPQGLYLEVGMYLTFSGRDIGFTHNDTIEIQCQFDLPKGSIVHDSWLYLNDEILVADLIDRWTATSIYNAIVGRRMDPSILYKTNNNNYELRIYPTLGDSTRMVKIAYLVPLNFSSNSVSASLPMDLLKASRYPINNVKIRVETDNTWKNPKIAEYPELTFVTDENERTNTNKLLTFNSNNYNYPFTLEFDSPMKNGVFVNYLDEEENYYQIAFMPSSIIDDIPSKNILVCVDYSPSGYSVEKNELLSGLKSMITDGLSKKDSFNIMFSTTSPKPFMDNWVSVKDAATVFNKITVDNIKSYGNLPPLLNEAIKFLKSKQNIGEILLVANTDANGEPEAANDLIKDLLKEMGEIKFPVHCANFLSYGDTYYYISNNYYSGNEYLYINLSRLTNGNYKKFEYWNESFQDYINNFSQTIGGLISSFDFHTSTSNGFCYSRFDLNNDGLTYLNKPFLQIGKYYGDFPLKIEVAGIYNGKPFSLVKEIKLADVSESDTLAEEIWAGNYVEFLENQNNNYSNEIVREIIEYSMNERVLSVYTAFLAVEAGAIDSLNIETVNNDGGEVTGTDEMLANVTQTVSVKAFPNPFINEISFEIDLPLTLTDEPISVSIYDLTGKLILSDRIKSAKGLDKLNYSWIGTDNIGMDVVKGTYIVVFYTNTFKIAQKIIKY